MSSIANPVKTVGPQDARLGLRPILLALVLALCTAGALVGFYELSSDQAISILAAGVVFFVLMWFVISSAPSAELRSRNLVFALWWVLLGSEEIFSYVTEDAEGGQFSSGAYSEAMLWFFIAVVFLFYTYRHSQYLRTLFTGSYKWVSWFGVMCLVSCAYAEKPGFSLAWIVKLFLAILVLAACNYQIKNREDLKSFLRSSQWALAFMVSVPILRLLSNLEVLATGRLYDVGTAPTVLSVDAGLLVLYSLMLSQHRKTASRTIFVLLGLVVMLLAGGKTGIVGCIFAAVMFFMLQGKFRAAGRFVLIMLIVGGLLLAFSPLGSYLKFYVSSGQAASVTGRSDVWSAGWQLIKAKLVLGRGFMSSRFLAYKISVDWMPNHLHNGFLEVMYNNGLIGLFVILMMMGTLVRNLFAVMRTVAQDHPLHPLAVGCFAVFLDIFINGMVSRTFGSRPDGTFMLLFSLVFVSDRLLAAARQKAPVREMPAWQLSSAPAQ
ncbi:MAG: exopolysaccharide production protein [Candidatus Sulfotelmatobacter sp.]|nr:exopolysaccharide production protein [Candidatus Sulfotelmatobacter sp.]